MERPLEPHLGFLNLLGTNMYHLICEGSAECSKNVEDCSEGEATGRGYGGTMTFQANGMITAKGEGWDCRELCKDGGEGGSRTRTEDRSGPVCDLTLAE